jgi:hypothetical protein
MKTATIPALRVEPKLREAAESVLANRYAIISNAACITKRLLHAG